MHSRSMCHLPSTSSGDNNCSWLQTVSGRQLPAYTAFDLQPFGIEQQHLSKGKLSVACTKTQACDLTDSKPDQQQYCRLSSQVALLQDKVDRQYKVLWGYGSTTLYSKRLVFPSFLCIIALLFFMHSSFTFLVLLVTYIDIVSSGVNLQPANVMF